MFNWKKMLTGMLALIVSGAILSCSPEEDVTESTGSETHTVEFLPGRMYEFVGLWVKPGKEEQLKSYFQTAFPLAMRYGVRPVLSIAPQSSYAGDFMPHMFFINEWPDRETFQRFTNDPEFVRNVGRRDDALSNFVNTHAEVPESYSIGLNEGDFLEFGAMWIHNGKENDLREYYSAAFSIAEEYGIKRVASFVPIGNYAGDFMPSGMGLNRWPDEVAFRTFIEDERTRRLIPQRDAALSRLVVTHGTAHFEGEAE